MKKTIYTIIILVVFGAVAWALATFLPAGNPDAEEGIQVVVVDSTSFRFDPEIIYLKAGEPVRLKVFSDGEHTFTVDGLDLDIETPAGETNYEFTPAGEGEYELYCKTGGHMEQGQVGKIIITN